MHLATSIHWLIAGAVLVMLFDFKHHWRRSHYPGLLLGIISLTILLAVLWLVEWINMVYTSFYLLGLGLVICAFYLYNPSKIHFLLLALGIGMNGLAIILNNGRMPLIYSDSDWPRAVAPFLCDWIRVPFLLNRYSSGDVLIVLFLFAVFSSFFYRLAILFWRAFRKRRAI